MGTFQGVAGPIRGSSFTLTAMEPADVVKNANHIEGG